jgi:hypothetical protein
MFRTKISTALISLIAALSIAGPSLVPSAAQAQYHNYCVGGHCFTHTNFTIGGQSPCTAIGGSYDKAYGGLLEALQNQKELPTQVHPKMTPAEAQAAVEDAEAQLHLASIASFEWGCSITSQAASVPGVKVPVGLVGPLKASVRRATSPSFHLQAHVVSASVR